MEYYSAINKEYIWISSNEVDETGAYYTEWSKSERKTPVQYTNRYVITVIAAMNLKDTYSLEGKLWPT